MRRSVGTRPKVKRAEQEKCDSRLFAIIRGGISHASTPNKHPSRYGSKNHIHLDTFFSKSWENFLNPKYTLISYKIQSFGKNVSNIIKPQNESIFQKKLDYNGFSWTRPVFRTCPKPPLKNELDRYRKYNVSKLKTHISTGS